MTTLIFVMFILVWLEMTQHLPFYGVCYCEFPLYNEPGGGKSPPNLKIISSFLTFTYSFI
jgi:hypothetical protein